MTVALDDKQQPPLGDDARAAASAATSPDEVTANDDGPVRRKRPAVAVGARLRGRPRKVRVESTPPPSQLAVAEETDAAEDVRQTAGQHVTPTAETCEGTLVAVAALALALRDAQGGGEGGDESAGTGAPEAEATEEAAEQQPQQPQQRQEAHEQLGELGGAGAESASRENEQETAAQETPPVSPPPPLPAQASSATSESSSSAGHSSIQTPAAPEARESESGRRAPKAPPKMRRSRISAASARSLFQFTCKTLQSQRLEYEVRARELGEKTAQLAAEREKWEKKIRSVKRRLRDYGHPVDILDAEVDGANGVLSAGVPSAGDTYLLSTADWTAAPPAWPTAPPATTTAARGVSMDTSLVTMRDALSSRAGGFSGAGVGGIADAHIPVSIRHLEAQIRDTLKARKCMVMDMMRDLQGLSDRQRK